MGRQEAYKLVQGHALRAWDEERSFRDLLREDPAISEHLDGKALDELFDVQYHLQYVDEAYRRLDLPIA